MTEKRPGMDVWLYVDKRLGKEAMQCICCFPESVLCQLITQLLLSRRIRGLNRDLQDPHDRADDLKNRACVQFSVTSEAGVNCIADQLHVDMGQRFVECHMSATQDDAMPMSEIS